MAHIFSINISNGGVPKRPIPSGDVGAEGLAGDAQKQTHIHGGPDKALCLFPLELILKLQGEGHPIFVGSTGENLTIAGLDWEHLQVGDQLRLGDRVLIEITAATPPCNTIQNSFWDKRFSRISTKKFPGETRYYARILQTGPIRVGDPVSPIEGQ